ncbi:MAG: hypothetical protein JW976_08825 [Syntrophaceae bacterium]|nr:hypothetical protein [Syntrophaceae bacterium]
MKKIIIAKEKAVSLIIISVIFLILTLIWACVMEPLTTEVWSKPNVTQQEFTKDRYDCMKEANKGTNLGNTSGTVISNVDLYNYCMEARGWKLKEVSSTSQKIETYPFADGTKYEGSIVNGKPNGRGTYTWANGSKYDGEFVDGKISGKGTYTCRNGKQYRGDFANNKPVGFTVICD